MTQVKDLGLHEIGKAVEINPRIEHNGYTTGETQRVFGTLSAVIVQRYHTDLVIAGTAYKMDPLAEVTFASYIGQSVKGYTYTEDLGTKVAEHIKFQRKDKTNNG